MEPVVKKSLRYFLWVLVPVALLVISILVSQNQFSIHTTSTASKGTQCFALTGEHDYPMQITLQPPRTARPGERLEIAFSSGYYDILPTCEIRDGQYLYQYPSTEELAERSRTVRVYFDEQELASVECMYDCRIEFSLPIRVEAGKHDLVVRPSSWLYIARDLEFVIEVAY